MTVRQDATQEIFHHVPYQQFPNLSISSSLQSIKSKIDHSNKIIIQLNIRCLLLNKFQIISSLSVLLYYFQYKQKLQVQMDKIADEKIVRNQEVFAVNSSEIKSLLHRSIGALTFLNRFKKLGVGSGTAISPDLVLTAAHNIYDKKQKCQNDDFKFYLLGADGAAERYYQIESWRYLQEFKDCPISSRIPHDYALLKLKTPVPFKEYLPLSLVCQHCIMGNNKQTCLDIYGFPDGIGGNYTPLDKYGNRFNLSQYGQSRKNRIVFINPEKCMIAYAVSTLPGQSGTAVCIDNKIIAVHSGGGKMNEQFNVGRLLTSDFLQNFQEWRVQMCGKPFSVIEKRLCPYSNLQNSSSHLTEIIKDQSQRLQHSSIKISQLESEIILLKAQIQQNQKTKKQSKKQQIQYTAKSQQSQKIQGVECLKLNARGLPSVNLSQHFKLKVLELSKNRLTEINLQANINLTHLYLAENQLKQIDLSKNTLLTEISLYHNQLQDIDLSNNRQLTVLYLSENQLCQIDLSNCRLLNHLQLDENYLWNVVFWWNSRQQMKIFTLQYQKSETCHVVLLYRKGKKEQCAQWGKKMIELYNSGGKSPTGIFIEAHDCNYTVEFKQTP